MVGLRVMLLGGFEVRLASGSPVSLPTKKAQALLAYLGVHAGQGHQRDKLAGLLWGEKSAEQGRGGLRHALAALRRALAGATPAPLRIEGQTLALDAEGVDVDVATFERSAAEGTPQALQHAADLYRGDLLLGFQVNEPLFEEWLVVERERLREIALDALARLLAQQTKAAATERAIQTAMRLLALDPLQEAVHRALMGLYARQGRRGAALKQYQMCVAAFRRELGTEPEEDTKKLYQDLLRRPAEVVKTADDRRDHRSRSAPALELAVPELLAAETPLFGREAELARLRQLRDAAIRGHGRIATVVGEAGIGKTRLVSTLMADALPQECRILIGRCHESDSILPYGPWVDAFRGGAVGADEETLATLHPTRRAELTRLLPEAGTAAMASDTALRLFESVAELIERVAARQPLVLVLEDLHWADEMSLRLLGFVSRRISVLPVLLIATARDEELADASMARRTLAELSLRVQAVPLALSPLSRSDTALLVRALTRVGSAPAFAHLQEQIWTMSEGNPFVAVEAMHALDQPTVWTAAGTSPVSAVLPASVRELVARRLDRLGARSQQLTAVAAVIGRRLISRCSEPPVAWKTETRRRRSRRWCASTCFRPSGTSWTSPTIGSARSRMAGCSRRAAASSTARWPRRSRFWRRPSGMAWASRSSSSPITPSRARCGTRHCATAGRPAQRRRRASRTEKRWRTSTKRWPRSTTCPSSTREGRPSTFSSICAIRSRCSASCHGVSIAFAGRRRWRKPWTIGGRQVEIAATLSGHFWAVADQDSALAAARRSLALAIDLEDPSWQARGKYLVGRIHHVRGDYRLAIDALRESAEALTAGPPLQGSRPRVSAPSSPSAPWPTTTAGSSVISRANLALCLAEIGEFAEAVVRAEEALQIAREIDHPYSRIAACLGLGGVHVRQADFESARTVLEDGFRLCEEAQTPFVFPWIAAQWAYACGLSGRVAEALPLLEQAVEQAAAMRLLVHQSQRIAWLSEITLLSGRRGDAVRLGERALDLARAHRERGVEAWTLRLLGQIHTGDSSGRPAEDLYRQALTIAEELNMRPLVAHCHLGLGALHRQADERDGARRYLTTATTMYREMDMPFWLEQADAGTKNAGAPSGPWTKNS